MITLKRISYAKTETFGVLLFEGTPFLLTLEDAWRENESFVSCIPTGNYLCRRIVSPKFGETFEITGVPGRSHILFHSGNTNKDTEGCILLGKEFGWVSGCNGIRESKPAFDAFMSRMNGLNAFQLLVTA